MTGVQDDQKLRILVVAGEVSGDMHAAAVVRELKLLHPAAEFFGIGGPHMRAEGVLTYYDIGDMAVMGFVEVLRRLRFFKGVFEHMVRLAAERQPDAVLLIDYPGFNLRFAGKAKELGLKVVYYVCPQVWAWNRARIPKMARVIDRLITIFPFEAAHFDGTGLKVEYVGHPLVDDAAAVMKEPAALLPWSGWPRVALLPGSRAHVIDRMLPVMWKAAGLLAAKYPGASFIIPAPSIAVAELVQARLAKLKDGGPAHVDVVVGQTRQVLRQSGAAWVASGTATIEAALMMCPMVVAYRMAPLSYLIGRMVVKLEHIAMVNIIAGRRLCPEFIQDAATPGRLADAVEPLVDDSPQRDEMLRGLDEVVRSLGGGGAAHRAARVLLDCIKA